MKTKFAVAVLLLLLTAMSAFSAPVPFVRHFLGFLDLQHTVVVASFVRTDRGAVDKNTPHQERLVLLRNNTNTVLKDVATFDGVLSVKVAIKRETNTQTNYVLVERPNGRTDIYSYDLGSGILSPSTLSFGGKK